MATSTIIRRRFVNVGDRHVHYRPGRLRFAGYDTKLANLCSQAASTILPKIVDAQAAVIRGVLSPADPKETSD